MTNDIRIPCRNGAHAHCDGAAGACDCTCHPHWRICWTDDTDGAA